MTAPKYRTAQHRAERMRYVHVVALGNGWCCEPICLMPSRYIEPGTAWDVGHDTTGTQYIGPCHARCNRSEGATRGNRNRGEGWNI